MRREPTEAEGRLWEEIRDRRLMGYKFRRQHALDRFIVDFSCREAALIIEVDGAVHQGQAEADQEREALLAEMGFITLRFTNNQVLCEVEVA